jgi:Ca2+-binding RTX toxin-like protein
MVEGTPGPDRIRIVPTQIPGTVRVAVDGKMLGNYGPVASIDVSAGAGNDTVTVDPRITLPTRLDGGAGNDRLRGGSGPNVLLGGGGNDTLIGNRSRDTLDGGPGTNRLVPLKNLGVVQVGPSASGAGFRSLSGAYTLMPLKVAGPAVVGAADLSNGRIAGQLIRDFNGGQPVALTNATPDTANALATMLGYTAPVAFPAGLSRASLITFGR